MEMLLSFFSLGTGDRYLPFTELHGRYLLAASITRLRSSSRFSRGPITFYLVGTSGFLRASTDFLDYLLISSIDVGIDIGFRGG
jgi:hypothetical protein